MLKLPNFISPHCHLQSLDSASTPSAFADRELELGTGALVVTDHGSLAACQEVYDLAHKKKLTPILGIEGYFRDDNCPLFTAAGVPKNEAGTFADYMKYMHFTMHFMDQDAYRTAIRLLSNAPTEKHGSEIKPLFDWDDLEELGSKNLTMTTGCLIGIVQRHLLQNNDPDMAIKYMERLKAIVKPGNLFVEVFPHVCSHNFVSGVFLELDGPGGSVEKLKYYAGKTFRTNVGEIKALELTKEFNRKGNKHTHLLAIKNFHTWEEREPTAIVSAKHVEDFVQNECKPWCPNGDPQEGTNRFMVEMARRYNLPVHVSDDSHYAHPDEKIVQDVRLAQSGNWRFYGSYHRQSSAEAWEYFKARGTDQKTFESWIDNSYQWAARFKDFKLTSEPNLPVKFYSSKYHELGAKDSYEYVIRLIQQHGRMDWTDAVRCDRLKRELELLHNNGKIDLLPYFMIDEDICRFYRDNNMLTGPGRGSAAGLLLTYLLGITHVDPIRYELSLDRFLTLDRINSGKWPDIDQDLPTREPLVNETDGYLHKRFGDHYAQISTLMTLRLSSAVLDVARFTMGKVPPEIAILSKRFQRPPQGLDDREFVFGYSDSGNWVDGSIEHDPALQEYVKTYPKQWEIVQKSLGLGRGLSRHACGFIIANNPVGDFIPLTKIGGTTCTQFTASAVEAAGGLKMDFLVVNSLNDVSQAIKLVQERRGAPPKEGLVLDGKHVPAVRLLPHPTQPGQFVDIWDLPEDQAVFADVSTGRTETVFQFNTDGAIQWLQHFNHKKPNGNYIIDSVTAMAAFTALDRPGPLDALVSVKGTLGGLTRGGKRLEDTKLPDGSGPSQEGTGRPNGEGETKPVKKDPAGTHNMLVEYARRAQGLPPSPDIPDVFMRLFPETYGVMVFQEQLQRLYQEVTGCTGAEAEAFRGDVAKKKKEKIIQAYPRFIEGASKILGTREQAETVWQFIQSWAAYGFNKSHAVCYSVIGYACAYLKHHYRLEWWCAVLNHATKDDINTKFWPHCGHLLFLPNLANATATFQIEGDRIQSPLTLLHGVGDRALEEIVAGAPYSSIRDLVDKVESWKDTHTRQNKEGKTVRGTSALNDGIVYKLIVSGAATSLFPSGYTTTEMLEAYEKAVFDRENDDRARAGRKPQKRLSPPPIRKQFQDLSQYGQYLLRKEILPAYTESVLKLMKERLDTSVVTESGVTNFVDGNERIPFKSGKAVLKMRHYQPGQGGLYVAVAAFIEKAEIVYAKPPKTGKRCVFNVDVDGVKFNFIKWPGRNHGGEFDPDFSVLLSSGLSNTLAVLVLNKYSAEKEFSVESVHVVQSSIKMTEIEEKEESKS